MSKLHTEDRKYTKKEVIELLKRQRLLGYVNSGANQKMPLTELIELK